MPVKKTAAKPAMKMHSHSTVNGVKTKLSGNPIKAKKAPAAKKAPIKKMNPAPATTKSLNEVPDGVDVAELTQLLKRNSAQILNRIGLCGVALSLELLDGWVKRTPYDANASSIEMVVTNDDENRCLLVIRPYNLLDKLKIPKKENRLSTKLIEEMYIALRTMETEKIIKKFDSSEDETHLKFTCEFHPINLVSLKMPKAQ